MEIRASDNPQFEYAAHSPYYKVYFKEKTVRMVVKDTWIQFELGEKLGMDQENTELVSVVENNSLSITEVYESVDLQYEVDTSLLTELSAIFVIERSCDCRIDIDIFTWGFILRIEKEDRSEWGWVTILGEQDYEWRSELVAWNERIYYVKIDDKWVQMPDGWKPGDPIPEEYLT